MYFKDIIGQATAKRLLIEETLRGKTPHARLIHGTQGVGKLPIAIAYARYLLCSNHTESDACGKCASCRMMNNLAHPDLHFVFPIVKRKGRDTVSDDCLDAWRQMLGQSPYTDLGTWLHFLEAENQQAQILVKESEVLMHKLSLKSSQGGWKVALMWLPEKMNAECANKLLKLLEEPPSGTVFILVSEEPDSLLTTIRSRTQALRIPPLEETGIATVLSEKYGIDENEAQAIAKRSGGSWTRALENISLNGENSLCMENFILLMRLAYARKIREMKSWSENMATMGREKQKYFLQYTQRMIRENFAYNFRQVSIIGMNRDEQAFAEKFSPFVNENNVIGMTEELAEAERHITQNVNARMVFFDLALKMIVLIKNK